MVHTARHEGVHQVVAGNDAGEHVADVATPFFEALISDDGGIGQC